MELKIHPDENWTIDADDGKKIYGKTNKLEDSGRCVVMVHGLTGHMNEYQNKIAANILAQAGFTVLRFNLYDGEKDGRSLTDSTLKIHANDLKTVMKEKTSDFDEIYMIGHSYGGPTVMIAEPRQVDAICLWDPSFDLPSIWTWDDVKLIEKNGLRFFGTAVECLIGDEFIKEAYNEYDVEECLKLSESVNRPILVLHADKFRYAKQDISWHSAGHPESERIILEDTDHCFWDGQNLEQVLKHTINWFNKYSKVSVQ